jgi:hypothetical protein
MINVCIRKSRVNSGRNGFFRCIKYNAATCLQAVYICGGYVHPTWTKSANVGETPPSLLMGDIAIFKKTLWGAARILALSALIALSRAAYIFAPPTKNFLSVLIYALPQTF